MSLRTRIAARAKEEAAPLPPLPRQASSGPSWRFILYLGIFFFPYIFAWLTLRKEHGWLARIISFGWMTIVILSITMP